MSTNKYTLPTNEHIPLDALIERGKVVIPPEKHEEWQNFADYVNTKPDDNEAKNIFETTVKILETIAENDSMEEATATIKKSFGVPSIPTWNSLLHFADKQKGDSFFNTYYADDEQIKRMLLRGDISRDPFIKKVTTKNLQLTKKQFY